MKIEELRTKFPSLKIPSYPRNTPYNILKNTYEQWKKKAKDLKRGSTIHSYIFMVLMGLQLIFTKIFKVEFLAGFFEDQLFFIDKYEKLFLSLGRKINTPSVLKVFIDDEEDNESESNGISIEFKIILTILFYSIIIIILRMIFSKDRVGVEIKDKILQSLSGKKPSIDSVISNLMKNQTSSEKNDVKASRTPKYSS